MNTIQFTPHEQKVMERLRKSAGQWRWRRWVLLGLSLFCFLCFGYIGVSLYDQVHWEALTVHDCLTVGIYWPKLMFMMVLGMWFAIWPLANWHGNATHILLLKLVDAHTADADRES